MTQTRFPVLKSAFCFLLLSCPLLAAAPSPPDGTRAESVGPAIRFTRAVPGRRLVLQPGSALWVKGSTSRRTFQLSSRILLGSALLKAPVDPSRGGDPLFLAVKNHGLQAMSLVVPVDQLKSDDPDLPPAARYSLVGPHAVLRGKSHPEIQFRLEDESLAESPRPGVRLFRAHGKLSMAGLSRVIPLEAEAVFSGRRVRLTGVVPVRLVDFGLQPDASAWGAMGPKDSVKVYFDLLFGPEDASGK